MISSVPFISSVRQPTDFKNPPIWFVFSESRLLVLEEDTAVRLPRLLNITELPLDTDLKRHFYLGYINQDNAIHCYVAEVPKETVVSENFAFVGLRQLYTRLNDEMLTLAGRALQLLDWDRTHLFCSRCGAPAEKSDSEHVKRCPICDYSMYPKLAPAIIVRVQRSTKNGREILLARGPHYPPGWFSVLAGFVEPGESLEMCVAREVYEEVGLRVKNIQYFGSQPWPFPHSLMLGFTADYHSGHIVPQKGEIEEAYWFRPDNMPQIPPRMSISRHLIDDFLKKNR